MYHSCGHLLFFALLMLGFASCKKEDDRNATYSPSYHVDGITDLTLVKESFGGAAPSLSLNVVYENSSQERVTISLENVPPGLQHTIFTPTGIPTFSSMLSFADSGVAEGTYALRLVTTGEHTGRRALPFTMHVTSVADCTHAITGNGYVANSACVSDTFTVNILPTSVKNRVIISNFDNAGTRLFANVICEAQSLTIPEQVAGGAVYAGQGGYSLAHNVSLSINKTANGITTNCPMYMSK